MDRGAWQATVHGVAQSQIQLNNFAPTHVLIGKGLKTNDLRILFQKLEKDEQINPPKKAEGRK